VIGCNLDRAFGSGDDVGLEDGFDLGLEGAGYGAHPIQAIDVKGFVRSVLVIPEKVS